MQYIKEVTYSNPGTVCNILLISMLLCCAGRSEVPHVCGNGAREDKEECDAGSFGLVNADKCCSDSCHLKKPAICR